MPSDRLIFTSGGTEANNLAVLGLAAAMQRAGTALELATADHDQAQQRLALVEEGPRAETIAAQRGDGLGRVGQVRRDVGDQVGALAGADDEGVGEAVDVDAMKRVWNSRR